ncbi:MAG: hypothetical protein JXP34_23960 [Planctomycetes bacterium]|nr:hypothetical protein [Planctomycetota bacterium]
MRELVVLALVAFCVSCWVMFHPIASGQAGPAEERIRTIMDRGSIACGTPEGVPAGALEELGARLASRIGVRLDMRSLPSDILLAALSQGAVDVILWPPGDGLACPTGPEIQVRGAPCEPRVVLRSADRMLAAVVNILQAGERGVPRVRSAARRGS